MAKEVELSYNDAMAEIETILEKIENDAIDVDNLAQQVKRVATLLAFCKNKLTVTQSEVEKVLKDIEG